MVFGSGNATKVWTSLLVRGWVLDSAELLEVVVVGHVFAYDFVIMLVDLLDFLIGVKHLVHVLVRVVVVRRCLSVLGHEYPEFFLNLLLG